MCARKIATMRTVLEKAARAEYGVELLPRLGEWLTALIEGPGGANAGRSA